MFFKKKPKEKTAQLKPISTKNLFVAECVVLKETRKDGCVIRHYPIKKYVLVRYSNGFYSDERFYTDIFTGTNYYILSNPFAEVGSVVVDNLSPLNIPYPYITYEQAREILQKANSQED